MRQAICQANCGSNVPSAERRNTVGIVPWFARNGSNLRSELWCACGAGYGWPAYEICSLQEILLIAENFRRERLDGGASLPLIGRHTGFATGLFEEGSAIPLVLDRNLR